MFLFLLEKYNKRSVHKMYKKCGKLHFKTRIKFFKNLRIKLVLSENYVYNISMNNYIYTGEKI